MVGIASRVSERSWTANVFYTAGIMTPNDERLYIGKASCIVSLKSDTFLNRSDVWLTWDSGR